MSGGGGEAPIAGKEVGVEGLSQGDVGGVMGGETGAQGPDPGQQQVAADRQGGEAWAR